MTKFSVGAYFEDSGEVRIKTIEATDQDDAWKRLAKSAFAADAIKDGKVEFRVGGLNERIFADVTRSWKAQRLYRILAGHGAIRPERRFGDLDDSDQEKWMKAAESFEDQLPNIRAE